MKKALWTVPILIFSSQFASAQIPYQHAELCQLLNQATSAIRAIEESNNQLMLQLQAQSQRASAGVALETTGICANLQTISISTSTLFTQLEAGYRQFGTIYPRDRNLIPFSELLTLASTMKTDTDHGMAFCSSDHNPSRFLINNYSLLWAEGNACVTFISNPQTSGDRCQPSRAALYRHDLSLIVEPLTSLLGILSCNNSSSPRVQNPVLPPSQVAHRNSLSGYTSRRRH